jgi:hypothetical protein
MQYVWSLITLISLVFYFSAVYQWIRLTSLFILIVFWAQKPQNILFWTFLWGAELDIILNLLYNMLNSKYIRHIYEEIIRQVCHLRAFHLYLIQMKCSEVTDLTKNQVDFSTDDVLILLAFVLMGLRPSHFFLCRLLEQVALLLVSIASTASRLPNYFDRRNCPISS